MIEKYMNIIEKYMYITSWVIKMEKDIRNYFLF